MYYRADWFKEAGLAPPKTFDDFQDAAIKLTDPSKNRFGFGMRGAGGGEGLLIEVIRSFGSPIVDDKGQPAMDRQKATDAVKWYSELFTKHKAVPPSVTNDSFQQIMTGFTTGQTAMLWHHTGSLIDVSTALGADSGKFGTLPQPAGPAAHIADVSYSYNGMSDPKNADADWAWLDYWAQPDTQIAFLESTGYFPSSTKVADDARVQKNPYYAAAIETLKFGGPAPAFAGSVQLGPDGRPAQLPARAAGRDQAGGGGRRDDEGAGQGGQRLNAGRRTVSRPGSAGHRRRSRHRSGHRLRASPRRAHGSSSPMSTSTRPRHTCARIEASGGRRWPCRPTSPRRTARIACSRACAQTFDRLDILVNNAGIFHVAPLLDFPLEAWRRVFAVNLDGALLATQRAGRMMQAQAPHPVTGCRGKILNISSGAAERGRPFLPAYGASKAALNHLSKIVGAGARATRHRHDRAVPDLCARGHVRPDRRSDGRVRGHEPGGIRRPARGRQSARSACRNRRRSAPIAVWVAAHAGMSLNGQLVHTEAHVGALP